MMVRNRREKEEIKYVFNFILFSELSTGLDTKVYI